MKWSVPINGVWKTKCGSYSIERVGQKQYDCVYDLRHGEKLLGRHAHLMDAKLAAHNYEQSGKI